MLLVIMIIDALSDAKLMTNISFLKMNNYSVNHAFGLLQSHISIMLTLLVFGSLDLEICLQLLFNT